MSEDERTQIEPSKWRLDFTMALGGGETVARLIKHLDQDTALDADLVAYLRSVIPMFPAEVVGAPLKVVALRLWGAPAQVRVELEEGEALTGALVPHPDLDFSTYRPGDVLVLSFAKIQGLRGATDVATLHDMICKAAERAGLAWTVTEDFVRREVRIEFADLGTRPNMHVVQTAPGPSTWIEPARIEKQGEA